jgi:mono/diheme cytochrome c family protein
MKRGWQLCVVATLALTACGDDNDVKKPDAAVVTPDAGQTPVERGQYLMNVLGACTFCHTPLRQDGTRDTDRLFAGVDCFVDIDSPNFADNGNNFGCISTRNLTPDATGLKNATGQQIKDAFRNGIRTDGKKLAPIMPYWIFHNMTDADADAVVAYLRSIPAVSHTVKPNEPPWSAINDGTMLAAPFIDPADIPMPTSGASDTSAMNGRYLSSMAGLCIDCHTPEAVPNTFVLDVKNKAFTGGRIFPKESLGLLDASYQPFIVTRNLTSDNTGLGGWSHDQIKNSIAIGKDRDGKAVCAATHGGLISPYSALTDSDLEDIVNYIAKLPANAHDTDADNCGLPPLPMSADANAETGADCGNDTDDDGDGVKDDGCPETGNQCGNHVDDDMDNVPDDGCYVACGNCQGPLVQQ